MGLSSVLLKKHLNLLLLTDKINTLMLRTPNQRKKGIPGRVLQVAFDKESTKFEITDFIKVSKKHRSNVVDVLEKDIFQYNFTGICIRHREDQYGLNTSFLIRNVFDKFPYELNVPLYSPIVEYICVHFFRPKIKRLIHSKYYYLRKKPLPMSKVFFFYVIGMISSESLEEEVNDSFSDEPFFFDTTYDILAEEEDL